MNNLRAMLTLFDQVDAIQIEILMFGYFIKHITKIQIFRLITKGNIAYVFVKLMVMG